MPTGIIHCTYNKTSVSKLYVHPFFERFRIRLPTFSLFLATTCLFRHNRIVRLGVLWSSPRSEGG